MKNICGIYFWIILSSVFFVGNVTDAHAFLKRKKEKTENTPKNPEMDFMKANFTAENCTKWEKGKRFKYVGDQLNVLLSPLKGVADSGKSFKNKEFLFDRIVEETAFGRKTQAILIFICDGIEYKYEMQKSFQEMTDSQYAPLVPDMVPLDDIEKAKELLIGKTLYITSPIWYDASGNEINGKKLIGVKITNVEPGNQLLPVKISFIDGHDVSANVYLTLVPNALTGQYTSFDRLFNFENPRKNYKQIKDDTWDLITSGKVKKGMTKEESKLSLGHPNDVKRLATYGGLKEQWFYNTGGYLLFEDGVLTDFRQ